MKRAAAPATRRRVAKPTTRKAVAPWRAPAAISRGAAAPSSGSGLTLASTELTIGRKTLTFSNFAKVLYPKTGFTKGEVIGYYAAVADTILPHLRGRPLTQKRYPNGVDSIFFFEKNCPSHRPNWVQTVTVASRRESGKLSYCLAEDKATLLWVANLASLELHTLLAQKKDLTRPTMMVFDLDPGPPADILDCIRIGQRLRAMLAHHKLQCFPKTSGGKGLHLYVPLNTAVTFDQTKTFAHAAAQVLERDDGAHVLSSMSRAAREGKIFVDWSQNDDHKTTVCAYSLRAREHPTISTPVTWEELEEAAKKNDPARLQFEARAVLDRVEKFGDLFAPVLTVKQKLPK